MQVLHVDCANGVGAWKLKAIAPLLAEAGLALDLRNTGEGVLNGACGSDFLQKDKQLPQSFEDITAGTRCDAREVVVGKASGNARSDSV